MEEERATKGIAFFEGRLTEEEVVNIMKIVEAFGITFYDHNGLVKSQIYEK
jgi:hypothetical protein